MRWPDGLDIGNSLSGDQCISVIPGQNPHDRMKYIIVHTVENDHKNNMVNFKKDSLFRFWIFQ